MSDIRDIHEYAGGMLAPKELCHESWSEQAISVMHEDRLTMTYMVTQELRVWLREHGYPVPVECSYNTHHVGEPNYRCGFRRPACGLGICKRAVVCAGDW